MAVIGGGNAGQLTVLTDGLADLYPFREDAMRLAREVGVPIRAIQWNGPPLTMWDSLLRMALEHDLLVTLVGRATLEFPKEQYLVQVARGQLAIARGPSVTEWQGPTHEKIIVENNLLPSSFLHVGSKRAACVVRITRGDGARGTGFILEDLLVTNHHVLPRADMAGQARAELFFEESFELPCTELKMLPDRGFAANEKNDWAAVRITGTVGLQSVLPPRKDALRVGERVSIIQHPNGGYKQVALHDNKVAFVGDEIIQYFTDTLPGSSGSPIFDLQWQWVGIHHSGGRLRDPGTSELVYRNEGIPAHVVYAGIVNAGLLPA